MKKPTKKQLAKCYRMAANALTEHGWIKGDLQDSKGRMCAVGSIDHALSKLPELRLSLIPADACTDSFNDAGLSRVARTAIRSHYSYFTKDSGKYAHFSAGTELEKLEKQVMAKLGFGGRSLVDFNDSFAQDVTQVQAVLRGVARALEHGNRV